MNTLLRLDREMARIGPKRRDTGPGSRQLLSLHKRRDRTGGRIPEPWHKKKRDTFDGVPRQCRLYRCRRGLALGNFQ
jgi:hypothetical protein